MSSKQPYIESDVGWDIEHQTRPRPESWIPIPPANSPVATKDAATAWESNIETDPTHLVETKLDLKSSFEAFMKEAFDHAMENLTTKMNADCTTKLQDGLPSHSADVITTVSYKYQPRWPDQIDVSQKAPPFFPEGLAPSVASECCNWAFSPIPMSARGLKDGHEAVADTPWSECGNTPTTSPQQLNARKIVWVLENLDKQIDLAKTQLAELEQHRDPWYTDTTDKIGRLVADRFLPELVAWEKENAVWEGGASCRELLEVLTRALCLVKERAVKKLEI